MNWENMKKKFEKEVNETDLKDISATSKISYDGNMFTIRIPRVLAEELNLQFGKDGDFIKFLVEKENISKRKGTFEIIRKDEK